MEKQNTLNDLKKCPICGEYKGVTKEGVEVLCICEGILCPYCKKNKVRRPISNYYNEKDGRIWHTPLLTAPIPCNECNAKHNLESRNKQLKKDDADFPNPSMSFNNNWKKVLLIVGLIVVMVIFGVKYSKIPTFKPEEQKDVNAFMNAVNILNQAKTILNNQLKQSVISEVPAAYLETLEEVSTICNNISYDVLGKMHQDLPNHFKDELCKSVNIEIDSIKNAPEIGKATTDYYSKQFESQKLDDMFGDWYQTHKSEIKIK